MKQFALQALKVTIIGGGIFGMSTAVHLARLGVAVTVINDGPLGNGASGRSLAWLNSARRAAGPYHALRLAGLARYHSLARRHPDANWLSLRGGLMWVGEDDDPGIDAIWQREREAGYEALLLEPGEVSAITPGVCAGAVLARGAIFNPGEGWVDLPSLICELASELEGLGGRIVTGSGKAAMLTAGGRAVGARTADGSDWPADAVVLAAGGDVPDLAATAGITIGEDTPIALLVKTRPVAHPLKAVLNTPRVSLRPTPDNALVMDSAWSERDVIIRGKGHYDARDETVNGLLNEAERVLEGSPRLEVESIMFGPKPIPRGGEPVIGQGPGIDGCFIAFSHSGATLGLVIGEMLADEIALGLRHPLLASFRPDRFGA